MLVLDGDADVAATFEMPTQPASSALSVTMTGEGTGSVHISATFADRSLYVTCAAPCSVPVPAGATVIAAATPDAGSRLLGWTDACSGIESCTFVVHGDASLTAAFEPAPPAPPWRYQMVDVSALGGLKTRPLAIDDAGALAGTYVSAAEEGVFVWDGAMHRFPVPSGVFVSVAATAGGKLVGTRWDGSDPGAVHARAFIASDKGTVDIGSLGGRFSRAWGIDAAGTVIGESETSKGENHAFAWKNGAMFDLGLAPGSISASARSVDEAGRIFGICCDAANKCRAVQYAPGGTLDLGPVPQGSLSAMSPTGDVLGQQPADGFQARGFLWQRGATLDVAALVAAYEWPRLGIHAGGRLSAALWAENAAGDAVGEFWAPITEAAVSLPLLVHEGGLFDLNDLTDTQAFLAAPLRLDSAFAINGHGQILAASKTRSFLLTPR